MGARTKNYLIHTICKLVAEDFNYEYSDRDKNQTLQKFVRDRIDKCFELFNIVSMFDTYKYYDVYTLDSDEIKPFHENCILPLKGVDVINTALHIFLAASIVTIQKNEDFFKIIYFSNDKRRGTAEIPDYKQITTNEQEICFQFESYFSKYMIKYMAINNITYLDSDSFWKREVNFEFQNAESIEEDWVATKEWDEFINIFAPSMRASDNPHPMTYTYIVKTVYCNIWNSYMFKGYYEKILNNIYERKLNECVDIISRIKNYNLKLGLIKKCRPSIDSLYAESKKTIEELDSYNKEKYLKAVPSRLDSQISHIIRRDIGAQEMLLRKIEIDIDQISHELNKCHTYEDALEISHRLLDLFEYYMSQDFIESIHSIANSLYKNNDETKASLD